MEEWYEQCNNRYRKQSKTSEDKLKRPQQAKRRIILLQQLYSILEDQGQTAYVIVTLIKNGMLIAGLYASVQYEMNC